MNASLHSPVIEKTSVRILESGVVVLEVQDEKGGHMDIFFEDIYEFASFNARVSEANLAVVQSIAKGAATAFKA